ncbi:hypothetical protein JWR97_27575, partial [Pseudomonas cedrina subsp. fulgida]|nr:hypothetical protein [Pseudomonas cedrina subsp. fulgida]
RIREQARSHIGSLAPSRRGLAVSGSSPPFFRLSPNPKVFLPTRKPPFRLHFSVFFKVGSQIA